MNSTPENLKESELPTSNPQIYVADQSPRQHTTPPCCFACCDYYEKASVAQLYKSERRTRKTVDCISRPAAATSLGGWSSTRRCWITPDLHAAASSTETDRLIGSYLFV